MLYINEDNKIITTVDIAAPVVENVLISTISKPMFIIPIIVLATNKNFTFLVMAKTLPAGILKLPPIRYPIQSILKS